MWHSPTQVGEGLSFGQTIMEVTSMKIAIVKLEVLRAWLVTWAMIGCAELLSMFQPAESVSTELLMAR